MVCWSSFGDFQGHFNFERGNLCHTTCRAGDWLARRVGCIQEGSSSCLSNNQAAHPTDQPTNQPTSRARNRQSAATKLHTFASCSLGPLCPGRSTGLWLVENNQLTEKLPFHWSALGRSHQGHARGDTALYQLLQQSWAARTVTCLGAKKAKCQNPIPANC